MSSHNIGVQMRIFDGIMSLLDGSQRLWELTNLGISRKKLGVRTLNGSQEWHGSVFLGQVLHLWTRHPQEDVRKTAENGGQ